MIKGIGIDILEIKRFASLYSKWGDKLINKIFNEDELLFSVSKKRVVESLSGKFAAKEAVAKAFGTGLGSVIAFKDLRILKDNHGKPIVYYKGKKSTNIHLSITHSNEYAAAFAILGG